MRLKPSLLSLALLFFFFLWPSGVLSAQERTIRGTVTDSVTGQPVDFPQVTVQGTGIGIVGDGNGRYVLEGVPPGDVTLRFQRIGYVTKDRPVAAGTGQVDVQLVTDYLRVEELVVTGRATATRRRNLANAVATLSGEEVNEVPQQTIDRALQGRVAGATISANSGAPGGGIQVQLRGPSSINAAAEPLYVIDGVLVSNIAVPSNQNAITAASGGSNPSLVQDAQVNRIADLNAEDIESIEILKGPSAAAIYGAKAGNGVVIITTKRGRPGDTRVRLSAQGGLYSLANKIGFREFGSAQEVQETYCPDQSVEECGLAQEFQANGGQFFDHEENLADRRDVSYELSGSVSGGSQEGLEYFASGLWKEDRGIIANTGWDKQSARINLQQEFGERIVLDLNTNVIHTQAGRGLTNNDNSQTSYFMVLSSTPSFVDLEADPQTGLFPVNSAVGNGSNPLQTASLMDNDEDVWRFLSSANGELQLAESDRGSLRLITQVGLDYFGQKNEIFSPPEIHFESADGLLGTSLLSETDNLNINVGSSGVWERQLGGGNLATVSAGAQYAYRDIETARIVSENLTGGNSNVDAGTQIDIRERREKIEEFGFFGQAELLTMDERLNLTAGLRADQSSANGDDTELFWYPKVSASYRFPELGGALDEVKVRGAFGQTGNQPLYGMEFTSLEIRNNIEGIPGFQIEGTVGNPDIEPERQTEFEGGLDFYAFNGRGSLELTGYVQFIENLILERELAPSTGFQDQFISGAELQTWGAEAALALTPVASSDFTWTSRTTFTLDRSEITALPVDPFVPSAAGFGVSLGAFFIQPDASATQIVGTDAGCTGVGEPFENCAADGLRQLGNAHPDFTFGFVNDVTYKGFNVYTLLDWRQGQEVVNLTQLLYDAASNSPDFLPPGGEPELDEAGRPTCEPNDCAGLSRLLGFASGFPVGYVQEASFVKLREVSIGYSLPDETVQRLFGGLFEDVRITASGRDLLTITPYEGLDPEVSNFGNQQIGRSIDVAPFPPSRSFWLGVDLGL